MSSRKTILLLVAGLIGVITMFLVHGLLNSKDQTEAQKPVIPTSEVLAAARDLPTGTILKELDLKWVPWNAEAAQSGKFYTKDKTQMSSLVGAVVRDGMRADDPVVTTHIVQPHDQGFLAAVLTPGKKAMAVSLTPSTGVAGFVFPGDHVDVILSHSFTRKDINDLSDRYVSETVISDVRVLALDQRSDNQSNDPKVAQLATLEVTAKQAEKLALASSMTGQSGIRGATLSLILRSLAVDENGNAVTQNNGGTTWDSDVSPAYPTVNGDDGLVQKVQVMRGKDITETNFERHRK